MGKILSKVWRFGKTVVYPAAAAGVVFGSQGYLGPKAQAACVSIIALVAVFDHSPLKKPEEAQAQPAPQDLLSLSQQAAKR